MQKAGGLVVGALDGSIPHLDGNTDVARPRKIIGYCAQIARHIVSDPWPMQSAWQLSECGGCAVLVGGGGVWRPAHPKGLEAFTSAGSLALWLSFECVWLRDDLSHNPDIFARSPTKLYGKGFLVAAVMDSNPWETPMLHMDLTPP